MGVLTKSIYMSYYIILWYDRGEENSPVARKVVELGNKVYGDDTICLYRE